MMAGLGEEGGWTGRGKAGLGEGGTVDLGEGRLDWVRREGMGDGEKATVDWRRGGRWTGRGREDWMEWTREGRLDRRGSEGWTGRGREG
jgi:hypothetical protein